MSEMDLQPNLKEIREEWNCGKTCRGCDFLRECDCCGDKFCGSYPYDDDWTYDNDVNIYCPICTAVNKIKERMKIILC